MPQATPLHDCIECAGVGSTLGTAWINGREVDTGGACSECDGTGKVSPTCSCCLNAPADHGYNEDAREWHCYQCALADEERQAERVYRARSSWSRGPAADPNGINSWRGGL